MIANTTLAPAPAPSTDSDTARQFASFASLTSLPSAVAMSCSKSLPVIQVEFAFFTSPVLGEIVPGIPIPTVPF